MSDGNDIGDACDPNFGHNPVDEFTDPPPAPPLPEMVPVVPERLLDTRTAQIGYTGAKPTAGQVVEVQVTGAGATSIPGDAEAVVLNVTGVDATAAGHVTVWPCGADRPNTSNLNLSTGQTAPNLVVSKIGTDGKVCLYTKTGTHLLADVTGFYPAGSSYTPVVPERQLDTRTAQIGYTGPKPTAGQVVELKVTGTGTTNVPGTAEAVVLNVTGVDATAAGHVTVWPCGCRPSEHVEPEPGRGADGPEPGDVEGRHRREGVPLLEVRRSPPRGHHGLLPGGQRVRRRSSPSVSSTPAPPRSGTRAEADRRADRRVEGHRRRGRRTCPGTAQAVVLNVTGVDATAAGHVTVYPCGAARPEHVEPQPRSRADRPEPRRLEGRDRRQGVPLHEVRDRTHRWPTLNGTGTARRVPGLPLRNIPYAPDPRSHSPP